MQPFDVIKSVIGLFQRISFSKRLYVSDNHWYFKFYIKAFIRYRYNKIDLHENV